MIFASKTVESSYKSGQVELLIKDLSGIACPVSIEERDKRVAEGEFERGILIDEYPMSEEYFNTAKKYIDSYMPNLASCIRILAEKLYAAKGKDLVLVSIIRAGVPVGILLKNYFLKKYHIDVPHYAVSLVKGLDENAMRYILARHDAENIQFVDGWVGKGTVSKELEESALHYAGLHPDLAVLVDPIGISKYYGVCKDIAIPSAPFNAVVTGLVSITVFNNDMISEDDFHGAIYLHNWKDWDISQEFIDMAEQSMNYDSMSGNLQKILFAPRKCNKDACKIFSEENNIPMGLLNPGINEAARAILRRNLEVLYVRNLTDPNIKGIAELAKIKGIPVIEKPMESYSAISVAKPL